MVKYFMKFSLIPFKNDNSRPGKCFQKEKKTAERERERSGNWHEVRNLVKIRHLSECTIWGF